MENPLLLDLSNIKAEPECDQESQPFKKLNKKKLRRKIQKKSPSTI